jgi:hypothetical protein
MGGEETARGAFGSNYELLVTVKNKYDPTNFFRLNQDIEPRGAGICSSAGEPIPSEHRRRVIVRKHLVARALLVVTPDNEPLAKDRPIDMELHDLEESTILFAGINESFRQNSTRLAYENTQLEGTK